MDANLIEIDNRIRQILLKTSWNLSRLAKELGVTSSHLSRVRSGKLPLSARMELRLNNLERIMAHEGGAIADAIAKVSGDAGICPLCKARIIELLRK